MAEKNLKQMCILIVCRLFVSKHFWMNDASLGHLWYEVQQFFPTTKKPFWEFFCVCPFMEINISSLRSAKQFSLWSAWSCKWILLSNWFLNAIFMNKGALKKCNLANFKNAKQFFCCWWGEFVRNVDIINVKNFCYTNPHVTFPRNIVNTSKMWFNNNDFSSFFTWQMNA